MQANHTHQDGCAPRPRLARGLGLFGAGASLAIGSALLGGTGGGGSGSGGGGGGAPGGGGCGSEAVPAAGPVALWVADRDGGAVHGLDASLIVARQIPIAWPVEVEACRDGGLWVLRPGNGSPAGTWRLTRLTAEGVQVTEVSLGTCLDLACLDGRDALVIEMGTGAGGTDRLLRLETEGSLHVLLEARGLLCVADSRGSVAAGTDSGQVLRVRSAEGGGVLDRVDLGGQVGDLAPGPWPGSLWALDVTGTSRIVLLEADLSPRWSAPTGLHGSHIGPVPGEERLWIADSTEPIVRRFGPGGALELDRRGLPLQGLDRCAPWHDGGVLVAAPGAILHLGRDGDLLPGQGGFDFLAGLDAIERDRP